MPTSRTGEDESVEACIDALDEVATLMAHHPPRALAAALAVHLQGVLAVLHERDGCTAEEIREWIEELVRGACGDAL